MRISDWSSDVCSSDLFIVQFRSIPADPIIVRQNWLRAYDFTTTRGAVALNEYARANDPFSRVGQVQISVEVSSVIRASPSSFRVAWTERRSEARRGGKACGSTCRSRGSA